MPVSQLREVELDSLFSSVFPRLRQAPKDRLSIEEKRIALIAEAQRVGLWTLFEANGRRPVHQLSVRRWVQRKLEAVIPDLFEGELDYREILLEGGRGSGSLTFLGDVISVGDTRLLPAPSRAIPAGDRTFVLASGLPTSLFPTFEKNIRLTSLGRRLADVDEATIREAGIPILSRESFLGGADHGLSGQQLIDVVLHRSPQVAAVDEHWECYQGNQEGRLGFLWRPKKRVFQKLGGLRLIMWREQLGERLWMHWLAREDRSLQVRPVEGIEWRRLCVALDQYEGRARTARFTRLHADGWVYINFIPWMALYRWLLVAGAKTRQRPSGEQAWKMPAESVPTIVSLLKAAGVEVQEEKQSDDA